MWLINDICNWILHFFVKSNVDETLVSMVIEDSQPFTTVEDKGFGKLVKALNPTYVLPTRQVRTWCIFPHFLIFAKNLPFLLFSLGFESYGGGQIKWIQGQSQSHCVPGICSQPDFRYMDLNQHRCLSGCDMPFCRCKHLITIRCFRGAAFPWLFSPILLRIWLGWKQHFCQSGESPSKSLASWLMAQQIWVIVPMSSVCITQFVWRIC